MTTKKANKVILYRSKTGKEVISKLIGIIYAYKLCKWCIVISTFSLRCTIVSVIYVEASIIAAHMCEIGTIDVQAPVKGTHVQLVYRLIVVRQMTTVLY